MNGATEQSKSYILRAPKTIEEFEEYYHLRYKVLREPLGEPKGTETARPLINELSGIHVCAFTPDGKKVIGAAMGFMSKDYAKVHALCVHEEYQKLGLGRALMNALEAKMKKRGATSVYLNSRTNTEKFYQKLGYVSVHTMTQEEAIKITGMSIIFIRMEKKL
eukprot:TRINITY_DN0_c712_g1_i1.p1 TRINITY_DN0_c712_g1~~TRINITY_DN0_c712_g1_i1.p1  ORF type:complete len:163 (-),score=44.12 TRINITY_DN0_c712_g1_i1:58-546(-)